MSDEGNVEGLNVDTEDWAGFAKLDDGEVVGFDEGGTDKVGLGAAVEESVGVDDDAVVGEGEGKRKVRRDRWRSRKKSGNNELLLDFRRRRRRRG